MIYLDNAASSQFVPEVKEYLKTYSEKHFCGNPSSKHSLAQRGKQEIEELRKLLAITLDANEYSILFASSATEANNWLISSYQQHVTQILYFPSEHPSITNTVEALKLKYPSECTIQILEQNDLINIEKLYQKLSTHPNSLICLTHVHNITGIICPVIEIAKEVKREFPQVIIHVDGVQAFQKIPFLLKNSMIDSYVVSSHKIGALPGTAPLYIKSLQHLKPLFYGGGHEQGLRSSSYNQFSIISLKYVLQKFDIIKEQYKKQQQKGLVFFETLQKNLEGIYIPENPLEFSISPYIYFFGIPKIPSDMFMRFLEQEQIYVGSSSACSSKKKENKIFQKLDIPNQWTKHMLRVSVSPLTTQDQIHTFIQTLASIQKRLNHLL